VLVDDTTVTERVLVRQHERLPVRYDRTEQNGLVDVAYTELPDDIAAVADTLDAAEQPLPLTKHHGFREEQKTRRTTFVFSDGGRAQALTGLARFRHTPHGDGAVRAAHGWLARRERRCDIPFRG
jgi:hypothetical protein